jgi:hypothetical protein
MERHLLNTHLKLMLHKCELRGMKLRTEQNYSSIQTMQLAEAEPGLVIMQQEDDEGLGVAADGGAGHTVTTIVINDEKPDEQMEMEMEEQRGEVEEEQRGKVEEEQRGEVEEQRGEVEEEQRGELEEKKIPDMKPMIDTAETVETCICTVFAPYLRRICTVFAPYLHRICTVFTLYLHRICTVFARYPVQEWDMVSPTEINLRRVLVGHR